MIREGLPAIFWARPSNCMWLKLLLYLRAFLGHFWATVLGCMHPPFELSDSIWRRRLDGEDEEEDEVGRGITMSWTRRRKSNSFSLPLVRKRCPKQASSSSRSRISRRQQDWAFLKGVAILLSVPTQMRIWCSVSLALAAARIWDAFIKVKNCLSFKRVRLAKVDLQVASYTF